MATMKKLTFALALLALAACNRDGAETRTSGANDQVIPTESMNTAAPSVTDSTSTLIPIGGTAAGTDTTGTSPASTITTHTPNAQTTTRVVGDPPADAAPAPTAKIAAGQPVFRTHCESCHGPTGRKPAGTVVLASPATQAKPQEEIVRRIREVEAHRGLTLQSPQLDVVAAYVKALQ